MSRLLVIVLALWTTPLWAQQEDEQEAVAEESPVEQDAEEQQTPTDPFDYESSEQISEDLSVSFPVDI